MAFLAFIFIAFSFISVFRYLYGYGAPFHHTVKKFRYSVFPDMNPSGFSLYAGLLSSKFSFFNMLDDREQRIFVDRVKYIRNEKRFVGRGLTLTEEMEVIVSASLTQLTFGLNEFDLEGLTEIHLTPGTFYSKLIDRNVKGLTFESGRMILSWADFEEGYRVSNDRLNLGLHELAHALWLDYFVHQEIEQAFEEWNVVALRELQKARLGTEPCFLRSYASTNIEEFWACSVECFFEAPEEFKNQLPELYGKVGNVLNQDMLARVQHKGARALA